MPLTVLLQRNLGCPMPTLSFHAHVGCSRGTSRTSSGGRVKSSGGSSGAWSSRGSTSKRPFPGAQPCWIQSCGKQAEESSRESSPLAIPHSLLQGLLSSWVFVPTGGPCPFVVKAFLALLTLLLQPIKSRITEMHHHAWLPIFHPKEGPLLLLPLCFSRIPMLYALAFLSLQAWAPTCDKYSWLST